jgi:superfamily II DNA/RNA helicase
MSQSQRLRELRRFRAGKCSTLVATDVFARGIDLDNITHVVNFDPPEDADTYRHRIGRTGRAGRTGTGISLVSDDQWKHMLAIADSIGLREDGPGGELAARPARKPDAPPARAAEPPSAAPKHERGTARSHAPQKPRTPTKPHTPKRAHAPKGAVKARKPAGPIGTVKFFNGGKGYGFILPEGGGQDLFVHFSNVASGVNLRDGMRVAFEHGQGRRGPEAMSVRLA